MPDYTATVGGVDRTVYIKRRSIRRDQSLDGKADILTFSTRDESWQPETGQEVLLEIPGRRLFGGEIRRLSDTDRMALGVVQMTCADWLPRMNRRLVWASFTNQTAGAIVRALFGEYAPEFTLNGVEDGPVIESIGWQGTYLSDCIDELAKLAGFLWRPDYFKDVTFRARREVLAPYAIVDGGTGYSKLTANIDRTQLATRIIVQGGRDVIDPKAYSFKGDGSKRSFGPFQFPLAAQPTILVNGKAATVGIGQVDTGKCFYWNQDSVSIEQSDEDLPAPTLTASSEYAGYPKAQAMDDDTTTAWQSAYSNAQWLQFDFGYPVLLTGFRIDWWRCAAAYKLQYSDDAAAWTDAYSITGLADADHRIDDITLAAAKPARYWRMLGVTRATTYGYGIYEISFKSAALGPNDVVSGMYQGYYSYRMEVDDPGAIEAVKAIEGGDGIYEKLLTVDESTTSAQARLKAQAELMQYAHVIVNGSFQTFDTRWEVGQLVTIQTAKPKLDGQYLVLAVSMTPDPGWDGTGELCWLSTVTFGTTPDDWLEVFQAALQPPGLRVAGRENDVVMKLASVLDTIAAKGLRDSVTWSTHDYLVCSEGLICSEEWIL